MKKTAAKITDRAKRYRANATGKTITWGKKLCHYCGRKKGRLDIDHVDGNEENGANRNLGLACRPCNVKKGLAFKAAGKGKKTAQYNPASKRRAGARSPQQYITAALTLRGEGNPMNLAEACEVIQATPHATRGKYAALMNPGAHTLGEYMQAVMIHTRKAHDEGGRIIHETPKSKRRQFASEIASRKQRYAEGRREEVPF